jgi:hypothetical protein
VQPRRFTWSAAKAFNSARFFAWSTPGTSLEASSAKWAASSAQRALADRDGRLVAVAGDETVAPVPDQGPKFIPFEPSSVSSSSMVTSQRPVGAASLSWASSFQCVGFGSPAPAGRPQAVSRAAVRGTVFGSCPSGSAGATPSGAFSGSAPHPSRFEAELAHATAPHRWRAAARGR